MLITFIICEEHSFFHFPGTFFFSYLHKNKILNRLFHLISISFFFVHLILLFYFLSSGGEKEVFFIFVF